MRIFLAVLIVWLGCHGPVRAAPPDGFVEIREAVPGVQVELRYLAQDNFVGEPIDGYEADRCYLTAEAARALGRVQHELAHVGLALKVFDAYRPQRAVDHFVRWAEDPDDSKMKSEYYPGVDKEHLFRDGYIAARSGHSRGSTVDVTIVSTDAGESIELDMGTGWDYFGPRSWPLSVEVTPQQRANRLLLQALMVKHGFRPLAEEWWHFTLENEPFPDTYFDFTVR